ncbi:motile sperm domain-containing protein 2-like [Branchiostoma floridae]|uniref:Motile sperm domain-containing protein 2-like n=1 Tax=Branchiostoma floridae TaxID=7739 RepID=A0A9J7LGJ2_BRAFL|nr:motile sperm domain-containing protein 2-like [Branchiostoma floridae]
MTNMAEVADGKEDRKVKIRELRDRFLREQADAISQNDLFDPRDIVKVRKDDEYLENYLLARPTPEAAYDMLVSALKWRKEFGVYDISESSLPVSMFEKGALFAHNEDKEGHPILIFIAKLHKKDSSKYQELCRFLVFWLERLSTRHQGKQMTIVFDMLETGLGNMDMDFIRFLINCFKNYFPNMLAYLLVYEMPWILNTAWKIIKTWLPPDSVKKIKFVNRSEVQQYIAPDQLATRMGGTDTFQYTYPPLPDDDLPNPSTPRGTPPESPNMVRANGEVSNNPSPRKVTFSADTKDSVRRRHSDSGAAGGDAKSDKGPLTPPNRHRQVQQLLSSNKRSAEATAHQGQLLKICPGDVLEFVNAEGAEVQQVLTLTNTTAGTVAFKVKTTSPEKYRVRPSSGPIAPGVSVDVNVFLQPGHQASTPRDKFLVLSMEVQQEVKNTAELAALWKSAAKGSVMEHRLRCAHLTPDAAELQEATPQGDMARLQKQVRELTQTVGAISSTSQRLEENISQTLRLQKLLVVLLLSLSLVLLYLLWSGGDGQTCSVASVTQPAAGHAAQHSL